MAIHKIHVEWLQKISSRGNARLKCACFGDPDVLVELTDMIRIFGKENLETLTCRPDSELLVKQHGFKAIDAKFFSFTDVCSLLNFELDIFDISKYTGREIFLDLNEILPPELYQSYDIVIDPGTLEHCFNVGIAIRNMASMVNKGGYLIHHNPLFMPNHGFFNFNPTFFHDFYLENDFEICEYPVVDEEKFPMTIYGEAKIDFSLGECNNLLVRRLGCDNDFSWPVQSAYKRRSYSYKNTMKKFLEKYKFVEKVGLLPASSVANKIMSELDSDTKSKITLFDREPNRCDTSEKVLSK